MGGSSSHFDGNSAALPAGANINNGYTPASSQNVIETAGSAISGAPSQVQVENQMAYLRGPNRDAYQINGLPDYNRNMNNMANQASSFYNLNANDPQRNMGQSQQLAAYNNLANMAAGNGPSLARQNLQAGLNQTNQALQSQAMSSAGGAGLGNSQRNLLNAQANAAGNMQQAAAQASAAEQIGAMQAQGNAANALRSSGQNQQQLNMANQQNMLNNQMGAYNNQFGANLAQTQANMGYDQANQNLGIAQANIGLQGANSGAAAAKGYADFIGKGISAAFGLSDERMKTNIADTDDSSILGFLRQYKALDDQEKESAGQVVQPSGGGQALSLGGGVMQRGGMAPPPKSKGMLGDMLGGLIGGDGDTGDLDTSAMSMFSDERLKKGVRSNDQDNQEFMDKLKSKSFEYKNPDSPHAAHGRVHGVMAQDMEKSKVGADMVTDTPIGKLFNMPKAVSATLSSLATLNKRMDKYEKKKAG